MPERTARADDLPVARVDLGPGVRAAFTSRAGGVSRPPYDALNLGSAVGDEPAAVAENRLRVERWAGARLVVATQVHGARAVRVDAEHVDPGEADALVATTPDVAVAVYVADCVPVLLADAHARVVAAVHVGRAGLVTGVLQSAVAAMVEAGADPARTRAAAGPSIAGVSYEVPPAMRDEVAHVVPATAATTSGGTPSLDLAAGVVAVLRDLGVTEVQVDGRDTFRDPALFSHRRSAGTGRFAGVVRLV